LKTAAGYFREVVVAFKSINPHNPSEVIGKFEEAGPYDVEIAAVRAREAFFEWREQPASVRSVALANIAEDVEKWAEELVRLTVTEVGKPIGEARAEVEGAVAILRYYAQTVLAPDGETYPASRSKDWLITRRHPLGVGALITPWNFPVAIPAWKAASALGCGNTVLLKPAPAATVIAGTLAPIVARYLPEGVFQVVPGGAETGKLLVEHPDVAAVSFTGSIGVGRSVARQAVSRGAKVQCETGGQNPTVVLADADLDRAAETIAYAAMGYAGQKRSATTQVIAEEIVYEEVRDRLAAAVEELEVVDPGKESCQVGPMIEEDSRSYTLEALARSGGRILTGGEPLDRDGFYLEPTLVELEDPKNPLTQQEILAPVAALLKAGSAEDAVQIANGVRQRHVAAVFTNDLDRAMEFAGRLEAGLVRVNAAAVGVDYRVPFGNSKVSGIGPEVQGPTARDFYTETRVISISP
jgi:alpha-ketoglutaric semialdehyde dehydrogenase